MKSNIIKRISDNIPNYIHVFVNRYSCLIERTHQIIEKKGFNFYNTDPDKYPQIIKFMNGEYDFDLKSITKLEEELGESLILVEEPEI